MARSNRIFQILVLWVFSSTLLASNVNIKSKSYLLVDANSGTILVEKNAHTKLPPASITKIMTAYILFSQIAQGKVQLDELVDISEEASQKGGSKMFIKAGAQISVENLLKGMIISSGNDASIALAEHIAGSEAGFADVMNDTAASLNMGNSHFMNATGWPDDNHYTTAHDISLLTRALIQRFPKLYAIFNERSFTYGKSPKGKPITQHNRNGLLWVKSLNADGVKTGHTDAAGYCLVGSAVRDNMRLISVVMQTQSKRERVSQSRALLNFGLKTYRTKKMFAKHQAIGQNKVWKGKASTVNIGPAGDALVTVKKIQLEDIRTESVVHTKLIAPLALHQPVGEMKFFVKEEMVGTAPLVTLEAIPEAGFFGRLFDSILLWVF